MQETVRIEKLVHGGQALATLADGRKVFVWNALPGELVVVRIIKTKKSYAEAIAEEIIEASPERIEPSEDNYLATSPWQIMTFDAENEQKRTVVAELFAHENVRLPDGSLNQPVVTDGNQWHYRSKMEYSFWGDDDGLHLALHQRGSHGKQIVQGSKLALPAVDAGAQAVCAALNQLKVRAGDLKTVIVRADQRGNAVAALYCKRREFPALPLPSQLQGMRIYYSNPKSPASVPTELLHETGNCILQDSLLNKNFIYDVDSFFQVNLPVFEQALASMAKQITKLVPIANDVTQQLGIVDMYAGVGSIGLSLGAKNIELIELDPASVRMAAQNAQAHDADVAVIEASTEKVLDYITSDKPVIFDPPRAGLHDKVTDRVLQVLPPVIVYLSCNPATHARDLARMQDAYTIVHFEIFNFFPRTPHIETLAILIKK